MLQRAYISSFTLLRRALAALGVLRLLDRFSTYRPVHWFRSLFAVYDVEDLVHLSTPWWSYKAIDEVEAWLGARSEPVRAFEWGAGASTMWLAARVDHVDSVEHHADFAATVSALAPPNVDLHIVQAVEAGAVAEAPSRKPGHEHLDFDRYVRTIDEVGGRFDLIVIDGRARATCLAAALPHLAEGGLIVFDNTDREEYRVAMAEHGLVPRDLRGLTPAAPFPTTTSLITATGSAR